MLAFSTSDVKQPAVEIFAITHLPPSHENWIVNKNTALLLLAVALAAGCSSQDSQEPRAAGVAAASRDSSGWEADLRSGYLHGFDLLTLLNEPLVQGELELSEEQVRRVASEVDIYLRQLRRMVQDLQAATHEAHSPQERKRQIESTDRRRRALLGAHGADCAGLLTPPQRRRLGEVVLQLSGFDAFFGADVAEYLAYTVDQRRDIALLRDGAALQAARLFSRKAGQRQDPDKLASARRELLESALKDAVSVLTTRQRRTYDVLCGKPLPFTADDLTLTLVQPAAPGLADTQRGGENVD